MQTPLGRHGARAWARRVGAAAARISPVQTLVRHGVRAGVVPRAIWIRLPAPTAFDIAVGTDGSFRLADIEGYPKARHLYWQGLDGFEPESLRVLRHLVPHCETFVDVGANIGLWSLTAATTNRSLEVWSFEALPRVADLLRRNLALNGLEDRVLVRESAASDANGEVEFVDPDRLIPTSGRLASASYRTGADRTIRVQATTLDDVAELDAGMDLVKIDVEGAEDRVLAGMSAVVERWHPSIFLECLPEGPTEQIDSFAEQHGYQRYHLLDSGPTLRDRIEPDQGRRYRNYLLIWRPEHRALLQL